MSSTRRNFYIPDTLYTVLEERAKQEKRSASDVLRLALVEYLNLPKSVLPPSRTFIERLS